MYSLSALVKYIEHFAYATGITCPPVPLERATAAALRGLALVTCLSVAVPLWLRLVSSPATESLDSQSYSSHTLTSPLCSFQMLSLLLCIQLFLQIPSVVSHTTLIPYSLIHVVHHFSHVLPYAAIILIQFVLPVRKYTQHSAVQLVRI